MRSIQDVQVDLYYADMEQRSVRVLAVEVAADKPDMEMRKVAEIVGIVATYIVVANSEELWPESAELVVRLQVVQHYDEVHGASGQH